MTSTPLRRVPARVALLVLLAFAALGVMPAAPARAASPPDSAQCASWPSQVVGAGDRPVYPVAAQVLDQNGTHAIDPSAFQGNGAPVQLSRQNGQGQMLVLDFGRDVSGKIEAGFGSSTSPLVVFSPSESRQFLSTGGDTQVNGNGDVSFQPRPDGEAWHTPARRTFRYLLVSLATDGTASLSRVDLYQTSLVPQPSSYQGWFLSSDPILNEAWYGSAYTLSLVTAPGTGTVYDGSAEIWRNQLDVDAPGQSRLGSIIPGQAWQDYTFDFDLRIGRSDSGGGWAVRASPQLFTSFRLVPGDAGSAKLQEWSGGSTGATQIAETSLPLAIVSNQSYHIRTVVAGSSADTSIDGTDVGSMDLGGDTTGRVAYWAVKGDEFTLANVAVHAADGSLLFSDPFSGQYLDPAKWVDAPQPLLLDGAKRDRSVGAADLAVEADAEDASFGNTALVQSMLSGMAENQYADGKMPGGLSSGSPGPEDANLPDYTLWWVYAVRQDVDQTGDLGFASAMLPHVQRALAWMASQADPQSGLIAKGPGIDWYWTADRGSGPTTYLNALDVGALGDGAALAQTIGQMDLAAQYKAQASALSAAINANLWDDAAGAYVDGTGRPDIHPLDGNALAVLFGIAPSSRASAALQFLQDNLWTAAGSRTADQPYGSDLHDGTIWPAYVYREVQARFGTGQDLAALDLLRRTWGSMLAQDPASTLWELANSDGSIPSGWDSLAHGWSTGALPALSQDVLGITPAQPGYASVAIAPHPGNLAWACGVVPSPLGPVSSAWGQDSGGLALQVDSPAPVRVTLPGNASAWASVLVDGQPSAVQTDAAGHTVVGGLAAGSHSIVAASAGA